MMPSETVTQLVLRFPCLVKKLSGVWAIKSGSCAFRAEGYGPGFAERCVDVVLQQIAV